MTFWFRAEVENIAQQFGLDADLLHAQVMVESSGKTSAYRFEPAFWTRYMADKPEWDGANPERVSASYGLLQCMYPVAKELGYSDIPEHLFAPMTGLFWGAKKLALLRDWAGGNMEAALAAYNGGKVGNEKPQYRNQAYIDRVYRELQKLKVAA